MPKGDKNKLKETKDKISHTKKLQNKKPWLGKKHSEETKRKISESRIGSKNPSWKGGITPIMIQIRTSDCMRKWKMFVMERDGFKCTQCGNEKNRYLEVDHIKQFSCIIEDLIKEYGNENLFEKAMTYLPLWDLSNARTLCKSCHIQRHKKDGK